MGYKIKTVIASVLKPVDDTRMYEKLGLSLLQTNRYEVNIIGFVSKSPPPNKEIRFFQLFRMKRNSYKRLFASFKLLFYFTRIQPELLILTTYEILPAALVYKFFRPRVKLVYDIQENYALNVVSNNSHSNLSILLARGIEYLESFSQALVSLNLLAEKNYAKEIRYLAKSVVILNKYSPSKGVPNKAYEAKFAYKKESERYPVLIFSGTISKDYGAMQSIGLVKELANLYPMLSAKFIGQVHDKYLLKRLLNIDDSHFRFYIDSNPIPHDVIMAEMAGADFGLVAHQPSESIKNCFPTRIYELMALKKPIILQNHPPWKNYCERWDACIAIDYNDYDVHWLADQIKNRTFYTRGVPDDIYWESEEIKLIKAMDGLFRLNH